MCNAAHGILCVYYLCISSQFDTQQQQRRRVIEWARPTYWQSHRVLLWVIIRGNTGLCIFTYCDNLKLTSCTKWPWHDYWRYHDVQLVVTLNSLPKVIENEKCTMDCQVRYKTVSTVHHGLYPSSNYFIAYVLLQPEEICNLTPDLLEKHWHKTAILVE